MAIRRRAVNTSAQGRDLELAVMALLRERGWTTMRSAGSKGIADVVALPDYTLQVPGMRLVLVQCKLTNANIGPGDRAALTSLAYRSNALPLVATRSNRGTGTRVQYRETAGMWLTFRQLTGTGAKDWIEWSPPKALDTIVSVLSTGDTDHATTNEGRAHGPDPERTRQAAG